MRLYPKKLRSLEELKREKQVLKYARAQTSKESFLDIKMDSLPGAGKKGDILSLIGDLLTSKSFADIALSIGLPMLKFAGRKTEKSILKKLISEVIGGYVKWKLLQMGMRGIRLFMKMQQTKKEKHKQEKQQEKAKAAHKGRSATV